MTGIIFIFILLVMIVSKIATTPTKRQGWEGWTVTCLILAQVPPRPIYFAVVGAWESQWGAEPSQTGPTKLEGSVRSVQTKSGTPYFRNSLDWLSSALDGRMGCRKRDLWACADVNLLSARSFAGSTNWVWLEISSPTGRKSSNHPVPCTRARMRHAHWPLEISLHPPWGV